MSAKKEKLTDKERADLDLAILAASLQWNTRAAIQRRPWRGKVVTNHRGK